jgi:hypothetical protein
MFHLGADVRVRLSVSVGAHHAGADQVVPSATFTAGCIQQRWWLSNTLKNVVVLGFDLACVPGSPDQGDSASPFPVGGYPQS